MANVNEGHRARLRQRMMKEGLNGFQDHEVLEFLLFQSIPRKNTNRLAHELINKFGSLANVLDATPDQLMSVNGISEVTACNLSVLNEVFLRCRRSAADKKELSKLSSVLQYAQAILSESNRERLIVVYVDSATSFLSRDEYTSDSSFEINIDVKTIVTNATNINAGGVLLFHCHGNGPCTPSQADFAFTQKLFDTLANLNIMLLEHIIFNNRDEFYSFHREHQIEALIKRYNNNLPQSGGSK